MITRINRSLTTLALLCNLALPLLGQRAVAMEAPAGEVPEEIVVMGHKPLRQLRVQIELAQDRMFGLFNELNDDDRYDILCREEKRIGTLISQRVCRPEFLRAAMERNAKAFVVGLQSFSSLVLEGEMGLASFSIMPLQAEANYRYPILQEKMTALVQQNPEFAKSVAEHHELLEEYNRRTSSAPDK
jgi:hypothetical protein